MAESFDIIERELGPHTFPPWAFAVVRRMIHASADFDFARTITHSDTFPTAIQSALQQRVPIVTDTEMVLLGIRETAWRAGLSPACHLNDLEATSFARE